MIVTLCSATIGMVSCKKDSDGDDDNVPVGGFDSNGASNAVFSVADGRTVHFSRGNLQYQASTKTWRFAEHQWDYIGDANSNISSSYTGWIDLFGWGTSGYGTAVWITSQTDYYNTFYVTATNSLTGAYAKADWGVYNAISNGGNQAGMWRTLTYEEWCYLLSSRSSSTGMSIPRFAKATVNGIYGLILFPDNFMMPSGMSNPSNINTEDASFQSNNYPASQWSRMEDAGCIFLPAAGLREETDVRYVGGGGCYWSSTAGYEYGADGVEFRHDNVSGIESDRYLGLSVRLVKD